MSTILAKYYNSVHSNLSVDLQLNRQFEFILKLAAQFPQTKSTILMSVNHE